MRGHLAWVAITLFMIVLAASSCANPQPLPVAPTKIPTLIPATLPPEPSPTLRPAALGVTFPSRPPSAQTAEEPYRQNCANCHGDDGKGLVPDARNFSDADYLRGESPLRFYQIISDGRGSMPPWQDQLTVDQRWDLAFYVWNFAIPKQTLDRGEAIYQQNCVACHGADGKGVVPGTPDFTSVEWMSTRSPGDFFQVVTEGRGTMPSWQGRLSAAERWAAIEYLRTFAYEPAARLDATTRGQAPAAPSPTEEPTATSAPPTVAPPSEATETPEVQAVPAPGDADNGSQLFVATGCVACHGAAGEGGVGPKLAGIEDEDAELFDAIKNGRAGTAMLGFGNQLSDADIRDLIAFIRQLD